MRFGEILNVLFQCPFLLCLNGKFLVAEGYRVVSVRRAQKLPSVRSKPASADSERDLLLATAEPEGDSGCASVRA